MSEFKARAALIEILQSKPAQDTAGGSVIVPNKVRINGQELLVLQGRPIVVHEIVTESQSVAEVTLTLCARLVIIGTEDDADALARGQA